ncbi:MAG: lactoylglutathione lyase [Clostridia bacterium]|nr:lactoylglutathione lyase [Clostridia bacterium]
MNFRFIHANINVTDLEKSIKFYEEALGMHISRDKTAQDGSFRLVYMTDDAAQFDIELTWLRDKEGPYNLGDNESHLAFRVDDYEAANRKHEEMGCICYENPGMGIYFIADPDNYWLEVVPTR